MDRAYSMLEIKSIDEEERVIEGIASTPTPDRMGDIVEPMGAKFSLPMPLLWQHSHHQPVGFVEFAKPTPKGIPYKARILKIDEPGVLKDRLDEAWQSVKHKLVKAVSIGFKSLEHAFIKDTNGIHFTKWEWMELSLVTIPANQEATITAVKSVDTQVRAASGREHLDDRTIPPAAPASGDSENTRTSRKSVSLKPKGNEMKSLADQIAALEASRQAKAARMGEIMSKSIEEGRSTEDAESEEFDTLQQEVKRLDEDLKRLNSLQKMQVETATPVSAEVVTSPSKAAEVRGGGVISVRPNAPLGTDFVRYAMAIMQAKGNLMQAHQTAQHRWKDSPRVITSLKAATDAGTTTDPVWAAPLVEYNTMAGEFIELLRPATILGRIPGGLRRVPFNVRIQRQTAGVSGSFVGEGAPKPVESLGFDAIQLGFAKAAVIVVMTNELMRFSDPSAEAVVRQDMIDGISAYLDRRFIDPQYAGVANVSPASVTNGVTPVTSGGASIAAITDDVAAIMTNFVDAELNLTRAVWIMHPRTALALSMKRNNQDQFAFPGITATGGTFFGMPVITSSAAASAGSPGEALVVLLDPSEILLADDGGIAIDMSQEASLQMSDTPTGGAASLMSLWQNNMAALRAERFINWRRRRDNAVQVMANVAW